MPSAPATAKPHISEFCPPIHKAVFGFSQGDFIPYTVNAFINVPLAIITSFANLLVLLAMRHVTSINLPSKLLLCSLVVTDLGAGLIVQPQFVAFLLMKATNSLGETTQCLFVKSFYLIGYSFTTGSVLTLTAISLDRYAALFFQLKYRQIVTTRRVCAALIVLWSVSLFCASTSLWNVLIWQALTVLGFFANFLVVSVAYIRIYRRLRCQQVQLQTSDQTPRRAAHTLKIEKYRRTASAMMCVYVLFLICNSPYIGIVLFTATIRYTAHEHSIWKFACTLVLLNSCLNPFLCCLRLREFRTHVFKQLRKISCRGSQKWTVTERANARNVSHGPFALTGHLAQKPQC